MSIGMQESIFKRWLADFFLILLIISAHLLALAFLWPAFQAKGAVTPAAPKVLPVQFVRLAAPPTAPPTPIATPEAPATPVLLPPALPVVKPSPKTVTSRPKPVAKNPPPVVKSSPKTVTPRPKPVTKTPPPVAKVVTPPPATAPSLPKASSTASTTRQELNNNSLQESDSANKKSTPVAAEVTTTPPQFGARYLNNPQPTYPALSKRLREEGKILLKVQVAASGRPLTVQLQRSSGYPRLDQAAITAVKRWRFVPAKQGEQAVVAWVIVPIDFRLN